MDDKSTLLEPSLEKQLKGHRNGITALFYSPNEQQIASSSLDNTVLLWDPRGTMRSYRFQGHEEAVMDVTFSPSGKYMATASRDKTVRVWVPTVTGSTGMFKAHSQTVRSVQFSPDGSKIITASDDKIVKMWSSSNHKFISSFVGHTNWVRSARMSSDGSVIASCSDDKTAKLWNPNSGECIHTYKEQKGHGLCLAWHPSGCYIAVGTSNGNVKLYDTRTHTLVQYYSIHNDAVTQVAFHPSGSYVLTASRDGKMKILDLLEGHPLFTLSGHSGAVNAVTFSPSGDAFASAGDDKLDVRAWYLCYHSSKYPVTTFVYLDDIADTGSFQEPAANSTVISHKSDEQIGFNKSSPRVDLSSVSEHESGQSSYSVGHISHIPRPPPSRTTYTIPSIIDKSIGTDTVIQKEEEDLFGMIKLKENDVCYTSGTIEWVGKKRSFPINSGFKLLGDSRLGNEPLLKKHKSMNKTFTCGVSSKVKECDCADILPTVNAIVDHLNALHEAVDLVDLRINTLEDALSKDKTID
ncbi:POC1 centriolar protein homolog A [Amyelois transitella]|uniref:POC1 centriolar protein homolog A n=1 Tax=Amyelois transitella TaxID=680683 RepID=UPI00298F9ED5|nr:POC1 centriolar protein homolog A [Amyelois transitella]